MVRPTRKASVQHPLGQPAGDGRVVLGEQRLGQQAEGPDRGLELVADVGDEVAAHGLEPAALGDVVDHDEHARAATVVGRSGAARSTSVRRGGPKRSTVRDGVRPVAVAAGGLGGQLVDGRLDQRLAVAGGEVARGHLVAVGDARPRRRRRRRPGGWHRGRRTSRRLGDGHVAAAQQRRRSTARSTARRWPRRPGAARRRRPRARAASAAAVQPGHDRRCRCRRPRPAATASASASTARSAAITRRLRSAGVPPRAGEPGGAGVLGQPAGDHVAHPLADVHGVVADALVVAADERELHGGLHVAARRRGSSRIAWM